MVVVAECDLSSDRQADWCGHLHRLSKERGTLEPKWLRKMLMMMMMMMMMMRWGVSLGGPELGGERAWEAQSQVGSQPGRPRARWGASLGVLELGGERAWAAQS